MNYNNQFLYSPRPEHKLKPESLRFYDNDTYIAQPKLNGSNTLLMISDSEKSPIVWNRHNEIRTKANLPSNIAKLHRGDGSMLLNGEFMDKSKKNFYGNNFNGNFVIFDILAFNGKVLVKSTTQDRIMLLNSLYGDNDAIVSTTGEYTAEKHLHPIQDNCWRVCNYVTNFFALYNSLVKTDMMEGLVLKKKAGILAPPISESINSGWSFKCRKPTKLYNF